MTGRTAPSVRWWFWAAVLMTAFKLWLTNGQQIFAIGFAGHDDRLFLQLAEHLLQGDWLGPYNQMTLAKGPFYSLWIACVFILGVPLYLSQHLLYAAACALLVRAGAPGLPSAPARFAGYALLLWNPMSYDASSMARVLRQQVYSPLILLIFAGLVALYYRRQESFPRQARWSVLLGLSFGAFWLTREEGLWIMPTVVLLAGAVLLGAWRASREILLRSLKAVGLAVGCALLPVLTVAALNFHYYRWFGTVEFRAADFQNAFGSLVRVRVGPDLPFVPITREAREAVYAVSPAFAKLRPHLEGAIGLGWAEASASVTQLPGEQRQIGGAWMTWALRDAVIAAGEGRTAGEAMAFYRRLAVEINAACADGRLPAGPPRSGFQPLWREGQTAEICRTFLRFADFTITFKRFSAFAPPSEGDDPTLVLFRDLTQGRLSHSRESTYLPQPNQTARDEKLTRLLHVIGKAWRPVLLGLFVIAQIAAAARVVQLFGRRSWTFPLTLALAAWGGAAAYLLITALVQVTSYPILAISSFAAVYPLLLVFIAAVWWDAGAAWLAPRQSSVILPDDPGPTASQDIPPAPPRSRVLPWLGGLVALAPFVIWRRQFAELFWFADDFFLVDQIAQMGLWRWTGEVFAENFVPLFKLLWGGALLGFNGSYGAMLWLLWLTHALNTALFGRLLARTGFPPVAVAVAQIVFALTPANLETLGWSVQWSALLATTFLLLALLWQESAARPAAGWNWRWHGPLLLFITASACCFSRGVLTGPVLALAVLAPTLTAMAAWRTRLLPATLCLLPALTVALLIAVFSRGNHQAMSGHWTQAMEFGLGYFLLNPGFLLFGLTTWSAGTLLLLSGAKLGVITWVFWLSRGPARRLLLLLLVYDLGNAVLLGIGRYHTGFISSLGSRYYYSSLLATLPFVALLMAAGLNRISTRFQLRPAAATVLLAGLAWLCLRGWPGELAAFTPWRGTEIRQLMQAPATVDPTATVPALDFMHVERAKALTRAYNLH